MKRAGVVVAVFLALGAAITLIVAWACAVWTDPQGPYSLAAQPFDDDRAKALIESLEIIDPPFVAAAGHDMAPQFGMTSLAFQAFSLRGRKEMSGSKWVNHLESGWPARALRGTAAMGAGRDQPEIEYFGAAAVPEWIRKPVSGQQRVLPLRPIPGGFLLDSAFYAVVIWLAVRGPFAWRRVVRRWRGRCTGCGYPRGESLMCSECGTPVWALGWRGSLQRRWTGAGSTRGGLIVVRFAVVPALVVALGAATNVLVAWGCAIWSPPPGGEGLGRDSADDADVAWWSGNAPDGVMDAAPTAVSQVRLGPGKVSTKLWQAPQREPKFRPGGAVIRVRSGWPMLSMEYAVWKVKVTDTHDVVQGLAVVPEVFPGDRDTFVPLRPVWPGAAVDTLLYALPWALLFYVVFRRRAVP